MTCECKKAIGTLEQERDELAARVARLEAAAASAANDLSELIEEIQSEWSKNSCKREVETLNQLRDMLKESPATSLMLHDAGVLRKWAARFGQEAYPKYENKYGEGHYVALTNVSRMMHEEANRIEQESKS
jgi:hypothetical protein